MAQATTTIQLLSTTSVDEILSTSSPLPAIANATKANTYDLTTFLLFLYPFYVCAMIFNLLSIYLILTSAAYRQYLSNVLLAVICIGAMINAHGQMFLVLQRWTNESVSNQLCSNSIYLRDAGSILIYLHVFILACERIIANLKKQPKFLHQPVIQRAHLFLILLSLISIVLAFTVPIFSLKHRFFSESNGLCVPIELDSYRKYFKWLFYGLGHPFVWLSAIFLGAFLLHRTTISYSTLVPMNRMIVVVSLLTCFNLFIGNLFDDHLSLGIGQVVNDAPLIPISLSYRMNFRDLVSILHKLIIGLVFFVFRPEIRSWLSDSIGRFRAANKETVMPQMLEIRSEIDDGFNENDPDGNIQFRTTTWRGRKSARGRFFSLLSGKRPRKIKWNFHISLPLNVFDRFRSIRALRWRERYHLSDARERCCSILIRRYGTDTSFVILDRSTLLSDIREDGSNSWPDAIKPTAYSNVSRRSIRRVRSLVDIRIATDVEELGPTAWTHW